uniref:hypothetical protein n=1 Tax=Flavobacterium sp. TaxID=239 RepID=UPI00404AC404
MNKIILMLFVFFTMTMHAQIEPIYKYDYSNLDDEDPGYITYTIKGKKYYDYGKIFLKGKDTILQVETEDIVRYSLYKKRYLFVSYFPIEQRGWSLGISLRNLGKLDVIDLKNPSRKWHFDFKKINQPCRSVSLGSISKFNPKTGKVIVIDKFSFDVNNDFDIIRTNKNDGKF